MSEPVKKPKSKSSRSKQPSSSNTPKLKVVIRRLPPNLPEAIFWQSVGQWVTDEATTWKLYVQGKLRTKLNRENTPSRAYVEFKTPEAVVTFNRDYNGHLFRDKQGNESFAVVEYAPFQKVPHEKRKVDARMGTIEADEDFVSFLNALNKPADPAPDVNELVAQAVSAAEPASTPLLDALKAAKESSTIKGYHSHYRDQANPSRSRAQLLDDEQTYSRKAPLQPKTQLQPDPAAGANAAEPLAKEEVAGKGKDKDKEREGGGKKGKNKQKPAPGSSAQPKPQQQSKSTPQPPPSPSTTRATAADPPRARPVVGVGARGGLLAAIGAATEARTTGGSRKPSGRQREVSGSNTNPDAPASSVPATPLPAGVLAIPSSVLPAPASGSAPAKSRRGGKSRSRGGGAGAGGPSGAGGDGASTAPVEMPRIDDPGQVLPAAPPPQRGRGGRGRGGRGRGRGRGGGGGGEGGGGGGGTGEQHGALTG